MATKRAVLVGLRYVNPNCYPGGWDGRDGCQGCGHDLDMMGELLAEAGFTEIKELRDNQATGGSVQSALESTIAASRSGDMLVFYYTGHGSHARDEDGDEDDGQDELLCLYDGYFVDDKLGKLWPDVRRGVRVLTIADSCHSGSNIRKIGAQPLKPFPPSFGSPDSPSSEDSAPGELVDGVAGSFIHIAGCPDNATSKGGAQGSVMTVALFNRWNHGHLAAGDTYESFHDDIASAVRQWQQSLIKGWGVNSAQFLRQRPFA